MMLRESNLRNLVVQHLDLGLDLGLKLKLDLGLELELELGLGLGLELELGLGLGLGLGLELELGLGAGLGLVPIVRGLFVVSSSCCGQINITLAVLIVMCILRVCKAMTHTHSPWNCLGHCAILWSL